MGDGMIKGIISAININWEPCIVSVCLGARDRWMKKMRSLLSKRLVY